MYLLYLLSPSPDDSFDLLFQPLLIELYFGFGVMLLYEGFDDGFDQVDEPP